MCINCDTPDTYNYNWYNTDGLPCTTCSGTIVCAKKIPAKCTIYNGTTLAGLNLASGTDLETIISTIDAFISNLLDNNLAQTYKNNNILAALNDINDRLNALAGGTPHAAYSL